MVQHRPFLLLDPPSIAHFCRRGSLREKETAHGAVFPSIDLILLSGAIREAGYQPLRLDAQLDGPDLAAGHRPAPRTGSRGDRLVGLQLAGRAGTGRTAQTEGRGRPCSLVRRGQHPHSTGSIPRAATDDRPSVAGRHHPQYRRAQLRCHHRCATRSGRRAVQRRHTGPGRARASPRYACVYGDGLRIPRPEHAVFKDRRYAFPQSKRGPVTCVQFSFGCPFTCEFCLDNQLYRKVLHREVDDMVEELVALDHAGFREVYFQDLTFGLNKRIATEFLDKLIARRLRLRWLCTTRVDVATPDFLQRMRRAGCYGIEFGVEHGNAAVRQRVHQAAVGRAYPPRFRRLPTPRHRNHRVHSPRHGRRHRRGRARHHPLCPARFGRLTSRSTCSTRCPVPRSRRGPGAKAFSAKRPATTGSSPATSGIAISPRRRSRISAARRSGRSIVRRRCSSSACSSCGASSSCVSSSA